MEENKPLELSYYGMYLRKFLEETDSPKQNDEDFINNRAEAAEMEYEERRRAGKSVFEAQECAMSILVDGITSEETPVNSEETPVNSEKTSINSEETIDNSHLLPNNSHYGTIKEARS